MYRKPDDTTLIQLPTELVLTDIHYLPTAEIKKKNKPQIKAISRIRSFDDNTFL